MKGKLKNIFLALLLGSIGISSFAYSVPDFTPGDENSTKRDEAIKLPEISYDSEISIEEALSERRSVRSYVDTSLDLGQVSQIFWAAQGITDPSRGYRTAPSAGALYPLEVYIIAGKINGLSPGVYRYIPEEHELIRKTEGDKRQELFEAALYQSPVKEAPAVLVFTAIFKRTTKKYGDRGIRYVYMEAGHASQNVYLQAVSLGIGTVSIGAFDNQKVKTVLNLSQQEEPLYIMPIGVI